MRRRTANDKGATSVEFAVIGILLFLVVFGIIDFARVMQSWLSVQHAARESARYAITGKTSCAGGSTRAECITWTAKKGTTGLYGGGTGALDSVVKVEVRAWDYLSGSWGPASDGSAGKQCDQLEVRVTYTHHLLNPMLSALKPAGITMVGRQRMTNEPWDFCTAGDGVG